MSHRFDLRAIKNLAGTMCILGVLCASGAICEAQSPPIFKIDNMKGGIKNNIDSALIPENTVRDARNVYFDKESMIEKRKGMSKLNATAVGDGLSIVNQHEYKLSNGIRYQILHSSSNLYYRQSGSEFTSFDDNVSTSVPCNFAVFMDTLNYCDGGATTDISAWDASTVFQQSIAYQPKYLFAWRNRLWQAGDADEPSTLRGCGFQNPKDWTTTIYLATSPVSFSINSQDGQDITGMYASPNGGLMVFKESSVWEIQGNDKDDFYQRLVISDLGCIDSSSVKSREGVVTWLSSEGMVGYDGNSYSIISQNISNTIDEIQQLDKGEGSFVKSNQDSWEIYTSSLNADVTSLHGKLTIDFDSTVNMYTSSPTISDIDYYFTHLAKDSNDNIYWIYPHDGDICISSMTYGGKWSKMAVIVSDVGKMNSGNETDRNGSNQMFKIDSADKLHVIYLRSDGTDFGIYYATATSAGSTWYEKHIATVTIISYDSVVSLDIDSSDNPHIVYSAYDGGGTNTHEIYYTSHTGTNWVTPIKTRTSSEHHKGILSVSMVLDSSDNVHVAHMQHVYEPAPVEDYYSGFFYTSSTVNLGSFSCSTITVSLQGAVLSYLGTDIVCEEISEPDKLYVSYIDAGIDMGVYSYDGTTWTDTNIWTNDPPHISNTRMSIYNNDKIGVLYELYYRRNTGWLPGDINFSKYSNSVWKHYSCKDGVFTGRTTSDFVFDSNGIPFAVTNPEQGDINPFIMTSTMTYTSEIHDTNYTSLNFDTMFVEHAKNDYDVTHYIRTHASSTTITSQAWTSVSPNSTPAGTAYRYLQYRCEISSAILSNSCGNVDSVQISYSSLQGALKLMSMRYDGRVWNAVSISSSTVLDTMLIWDKNNSWTIFDSAVPCVSLLNYNGTPFLGSDDGYIYTLDTGNNDNDLAINAYIKTKDYSLGSLATEKTVKDIYMVMNEAGNWNLNLDYYLNKNSAYNETFAIDLDQMDNFIKYKLPLKRRDRFYTINFKIYNENADEPFDLLGIFSTYKGYTLR